eukprot:c18936_g1_i1.p1 GENE.c18936_g1_i1~~c18936_g1_i1.p1  ORF type:complete len:1075 (+),score=153.05 c18936_g1_i1:817-4041(+)
MGNGFDIQKQLLWSVPLEGLHLNGHEDPWPAWLLPEALTAITFLDLRDCGNMPKGPDNLRLPRLAIVTSIPRCLSESLYLSEHLNSNPRGPWDKKKILLKRRQQPKSRAVKIVLVGEGGHGKTSLLNAIRVGTPCPTNPEDRTIHIEKHDLPFGEYDVTFWDFGGQSEYASSQQMFLVGKAMYLLVVGFPDVVVLNPSLSIDEQQTRQRCETTLLRFVRMLQSRVPGAYVQLCVTKIDQVPGCSTAGPQLQNLDFFNQQVVYRDYYRLPTSADPRMEIEFEHKLSVVKQAEQFLLDLVREELNAHVQLGTHRLSVQESVWLVGSVGHEWYPSVQRVVNSLQTMLNEYDPELTVGKRFPLHFQPHMSGSPPSTPKTGHLIRDDWRFAQRYVCALRRNPQDLDAAFAEAEQILNSHPDYTMLLPHNLDRPDCQPRGFVQYCTLVSKFQAFCDTKSHTFIDAAGTPYNLSLESLENALALMELEGQCILTPCAVFLDTNFFIGCLKRLLVPSFTLEWLQTPSACLPKLSEFAKRFMKDREESAFEALQGALLQFLKDGVITWEACMYAWSDLLVEDPRMSPASQITSFIELLEIGGCLIQHPCPLGNDRFKRRWIFSARLPETKPSAALSWSEFDHTFGLECQFHHHGYVPLTLLAHLTNKCAEWIQSVSNAFFAAWRGGVMVKGAAFGLLIEQSDRTIFVREATPLSESLRYLTLVQGWIQTFCEESFRGSVPLFALPKCPRCEQDSSTWHGGCRNCQFIPAELTIFPRSGQLAETPLAVVNSSEGLGVQRPEAIQFLSMFHFGSLTSCAEALRPSNERHAVLIQCIQEISDKLQGFSLTSATPSPVVEGVLTAGSFMSKTYLPYASDLDLIPQVKDLSPLDTDRFFTAMRQFLANLPGFCFERQTSQALHFKMALPDRSFVDIDLVIPRVDPHIPVLGAELNTITQDMVRLAKHWRKTGPKELAGSKAMPSVFIKTVMVRTCEECLAQSSLDPIVSGPEKCYLTIFKKFLERLRELDHLKIAPPGVSTRDKSYVIAPEHPTVNLARYVTCGAELFDYAKDTLVEIENRLARELVA